ncbi:MAG: hypothetical protein ACYC8T_01110 [Myxococcaceae bacterium]
MLALLAPLLLAATGPDLAVLVTAEPRQAAAARALARRLEGTVQAEPVEVHRYLASSSRGCHDVLACLCAAPAVAQAGWLLDLRWRPVPGGLVAADLRLVERAGCKLLARSGAAVELKGLETWAAATAARMFERADPSSGRAPRWGVFPASGFAALPKLGAGEVWGGRPEAEETGAGPAPLQQVERRSAPPAGVATRLPPPPLGAWDAALDPVGTGRVEAARPPAQPTATSEPDRTGPRRPLPAGPAEPSGAVPGRVSDQEILATAMPHRTGAAQCAARHREEGSEDHGAIDLLWTVTADGRSRAVRCEVPAQCSTPLGSCLVEEVSSWTFRATQGPSRLARFRFKY